MNQSNKLKPMSNLSFRLMTWVMGNMVRFGSPRKLLDKVSLEEGMVVVDYGCGPGRYSIPAAEIVGRKGKIYAVDIQPLAIEIEKKKAAARGITNIETRLVDSFETGIAGPAADRVLLIDAIFSIGNRAALFREIERILKPGGLLFIEPSHMKASKARKLVEDSGLFNLVEFDGRFLFLSKKNKAD